MNKMAPTQLIALLKSLPSPLEVASANPDENLSIGFLDPDTGCVIVDPTVSSCGRFKFAPMLAYAVDDAQVEPPRELRRLVGLSAQAGTVDCSASWR